MKNENRNSKNVSNLIYGRNTVLASLNENQVKTIYLQDRFSEPKILKQIENKKLKPIYLSLDEMNKKCNYGNHQGVIAVAKEYEYSSLEEIIRCAENKENPLILILDEVEDPHNFGAILRSCDAFGVDGVIIKSRNQVPLNMTVAKVSTGAVDYVKVAQVNNLSTAISKIKEAGFWVYAAEGSGTEDYNKIKFDGPIALVVGSEGRGISKLVLENSDFIIKIPMMGHVNSLNVSVSVGILLSRVRNK